MKKQFKKIVATLLCFAMLLSSVPSYAYFTMLGTPDFIVDDSTSMIFEYGGFQILAHSYNEFPKVPDDDECYHEIFATELSSFIKVDDSEFEIGLEGYNVEQDVLTNKYTKVDMADLDDWIDENDIYVGYTYTNESNKFELKTLTSRVFDDPSDETTTKGKITYTITNTDTQPREFNFANAGIATSVSSYIYKIDNNNICIVDGGNGSDSYKLKTTLTMDSTPNISYIGPATTPDDDEGWYFDNRYQDTSATATEYGSLCDYNAAFCTSWAFTLGESESKTITINYEISKVNKCTLTFKDLNGNTKTVDTFKGEIFTLPQIAKEDYEDEMNVRWKDKSTNKLYTSNDFFRVNGNTSFEEVKYKDTTTPDKKHKMAIIDNFDNGISSEVYFNGKTYDCCQLDFEYEEGNEVKFEIYTLDASINRVKIYPTMDIIHLGVDCFTIESLPDCDILIEPIMSEKYLYFDFEKKNDNNFPDIVCNQCDFKVEWIKPEEGVTTTFEYNTPYAAHITINGDTTDNDGIDYSKIENIIFNDIIYDYLDMGISGISFAGVGDETDVLDSYQGWYYDWDTSKIHVYIQYVCLDSLKLYLDNIFVDGDASDTDYHFDKDSFSAFDVATPSDFDIPDKLYEGQKMTLIALYGYGNMGIVDVNKFEVLEGENSHFKVSPIKKNDADEFITDLFLKYGDPEAVLFDNPKSISGNWINKNSYALISIFDIEITNQTSTPSSGSKKYKASDSKDTAEKVSGSGKKGSTRTITPIEGKKVSSVIVTDKDGNKVDVTLNEDGTYSFIQPASNVNVEVIYKNREITLNIGSTTADVDGEKSNLDVAPILRNDRTMLPIRFIAENLGAKVEWDEKNPNYVAITRGDTKIEITLGSDIMKVNGKDVKLDSVAFAENDRTYLPVRAVSEALNAVVEWNEERPSEVKIYE